VLGDRLLLRVGKSNPKPSFKDKVPRRHRLDGVKLKIKDW